jgi:hypothetical protein
MYIPPEIAQMASDDQARLAAAREAMTNLHGHFAKYGHTGAYDLAWRGIIRERQKVWAKYRGLCGHALDTPSAVKSNRRLRRQCAGRGPLVPVPDHGPSRNVMSFIYRGERRELCL